MKMTGNALHDAILSEIHTSEKGCLTDGCVARVCLALGCGVGAVLDGVDKLAEEGLVLKNHGPTGPDLGNGEKAMRLIVTLAVKADDDVVGWIKDGAGVVLRSGCLIAKVSHSKAYTPNDGPEVPANYRPSVKVGRDPDDSGSYGATDMVAFGPDGHPTLEEARDEAEEALRVLHASLHATGLFG